MYFEAKLTNSIYIGYHNDISLFSGVSNDPKRLLFWVFAFPALLVIVASNLVIYLKIRALRARGSVRDKSKRTQSQKQMDTFILMIFLAFVAWLVAFLPFVIVDTVLDTCFQVKPPSKTPSSVHQFVSLFNNPLIRNILIH